MDASEDWCKCCFTGMAPRSSRKKGRIAIVSRSHLVTLHAVIVPLNVSLFAKLQKENYPVKLSTSTIDPCSLQSLEPEAHLHRMKLH